MLLRTERLDLRPLRLGDLDEVAALNGSPEVMRFIGDTSTRDQTESWLADVLAAGTEATGLGWWAAVARDEDRLAGLVALKRLSDGNHAALGPLIAGAGDDELMEIGWRFFPEFWGRGYASETGRALVARAFEVHGFPRICGFALSDNRASCRAIEKCGLRFQANYDFKGRQASFFALTRAAWQAAGRGQD